MLYGRGFYAQAVPSRQPQKHGNAAPNRLPATSVEDDIAMLLRLGIVAALAVAAAAVIIAFAK